MQNSFGRRGAALKGVAGGGGVVTVRGQLHPLPTGTAL